MDTRDDAPTCLQRPATSCAGHQRPFERHEVVIIFVATEGGDGSKFDNKKDVRGYTTKKRDIHEEDATHLDKTKANYEELARLYPDTFTVIDCMNTDGEMRSTEDIQLDIRRIFDKQLDQKAA